MSMFFFFKQKTAYEMRISDWSSDVCSSDLSGAFTKVSGPVLEMLGIQVESLAGTSADAPSDGWNPQDRALLQAIIAAREPFLDFVLTHNDTDGTQRMFRVSGEPMRSEEHTTELQSLQRMS